MNLEKMFHTIDAHVAGEAFRIVIQSPIAFAGTDINQNAEKLRSNFDTEKNLLLKEPRGHRGMHGCIVGLSEKADLSLLFFNHDSVSNFKYEGLVAVVTALLEIGNLKNNKTGIYQVETADKIYKVQTVEAQEETKIILKSRTAVKENTGDEEVTVEIDGERNYLLYSLPDTIPDIEMTYLSEINRWGLQKTQELMERGIEFEGVILVNEETDGEKGFKTVTFEKDGYILRSPGIDTTFSLLAVSGMDKVANESIFGSVLKARTADAGKGEASLEATAYVTGTHEFVFDPTDPLKEGFLLA